MQSSVMRFLFFSMTFLHMFQVSKRVWEVWIFFNELLLEMPHVTSAQMLLVRTHSLSNSQWLTEERVWKSNLYINHSCFCRNYYHLSHSLASPVISLHFFLFFSNLFSTFNLTWSCHFLQKLFNPSHCLWEDLKFSRAWPPFTFSTSYRSITLLSLSTEVQTISY